MSKRSIADLSAAARALGRAGGRAKSERKTIAVRLNGRRGGRPLIPRAGGRGGQPTMLRIKRRPLCVGCNSA